MLRCACLILCGSVLIGCDLRNPQGPSFYTQTTFEDLDRIPLIKPYELVSTGGDVWTLILYNTDNPNSMGQFDVKRVAIADGWIVGFNMNRDRPYILVDAAHRRDTTFISYEGFANAYPLGDPKTITWTDPVSV